MGARIISIVNMKGGVGKSTTTVALAETLAAHHLKRVLVIDLDPQTNASIMLAGQEKWTELRDAERTLDVYFDAYAHGTERPPFKKLVEKNVTDLKFKDKGKPEIALVASAPEFRHVERDMIESYVKKGFLLDAIQRRVCEWFAIGVKSVWNDYDYILVDCPPGISLFAEAALIAADAILAPTIPDYVSRLGLIAFRRRALTLINQRRGAASELFVVATKYQEDMSLHRSEADLLADNLGRSMFRVRIPQNVDIARAAEWSDVPRTFEQKYGYAADIMRSLGDEFLDKVEMAPAL